MESVKPLKRLFNVGEILLEDYPIIKSLKYNDGLLVCTEINRGKVYERNVFLLDAGRRVIWQIEEPENLRVGNNTDAWGSIWFEGETPVARSFTGYEYSIELKTGKRVKDIRFRKWN